MINPQLQKHMEMCEREPPRTSRWFGNQIKKFVQKLALHIKPKETSKNYQWRILKPQAPVLIFSVLFLSELAFSSTRSDLKWTSNQEYHREWSTERVLAVALAMVCLLALRKFYKHRKEQIMKSLRNQAFLSVSASLGSIGAPDLEFDRNTSSSFLDVSSDDMDMLIRLVQAQTESLQALDMAIETIETSTRFFFGYKFAKRSSSSGRVLPTFRRRVDKLLKKKLEHLQKIYVELVVSNDRADGEILARTQFQRDAVITIEHLRGMKTTTMRLLTAICESVLYDCRFVCLRHHSALIEQSIQESQCTRAYLEEATKMATVSPSNNPGSTASLIDDASILHLALLSLHEQQTTENNRKHLSDDPLWAQKWQAVSQQSRKLVQAIDNVLADFDTDQASAEPAPPSPLISESDASFLECNDITCSADESAQPQTLLTTVETMVYSDVADPPKPRRRRPQQNRPNNALKKQASPFELVEELQNRLRMMSLPEERPVTSVATKI